MEPTPIVPQTTPSGGCADITRSAFDQLAVGMQRQLYRMGWTELRPIQVDAIREYFASDGSLLIMADTAGGKTEAAFLPLLSAVSAEPTGSVRAVYVGPLKALINDQFRRLEDLCSYLEIPVSRWHGDVGAAHKSSLLREPAGVLLITPESLESLLINRTSHLGRLFGGLRAIVIDEVHAFLESERGLHLASLISRLRRYQNESEPPFRTIGLSATVGDPAVARRFLAPDSPDSVIEVRDTASGKELQMRVHAYPVDLTGCGDPMTKAEAELRAMSSIASDLVTHCRGHSNLIFANAKGDIEIFADMANEQCAQAGLPEAFLVHHGSLAREIREDTEQVMKSDRAMTTVCSSTLEMGIDIGSVRLVGQIGAPWSVASFKQRLGRSGRRDDEPRRVRGYARFELDPQDDDPVSQLPLELLQMIAVCELLLQRWIEPPTPARFDLSTLTHQIMSTIAEQGAVHAKQLYGELCVKGPFRSVSTDTFARLLRHLGSMDIVEQGADMGLILGLTGEKLRNSRDFYAAFSSRVEYSIIAGDRILGTMPVETVPKKGAFIVFAGRRWQVREVDTGRRQILVSKATRRARPDFLGEPGEVHPRVREEMLGLLASEMVPLYIDEAAKVAIARARGLSRTHNLACRSVRSVGDSQSLWLTWTGARAQRTLIAWLSHLGIDARDHRIGIECDTSSAGLLEHMRNSSHLIRQLDVIARCVPVKQYRKYDEFVGDELLELAIAADRLDAEVALQVVADTAELTA
ncbi:MAG: DEAD/DEAH box helicase [Phycisphaerales bacterium]